MQKIEIIPGVYSDPARKAIPQGDVYLIPVLSIPDGAKPVMAENGQHIVTHSGTGHHHVIKERSDVKQFSWEDQFRGFIELSLDAKLEHLRANDTHATQVVPAGAWLIQRQAAYTPQGWEWARD